MKWINQYKKKYISTIIFARAVYSASYAFNQCLDNIQFSTQIFYLTSHYETYKSIFNISIVI